MPKPTTTQELADLLAQLGRELAGHDPEISTVLTLSPDPRDALREIFTLMVNARQERDENSELAREFRNDLQAAENEIRRLEKQAKDLEKAYEQETSEAALRESGMAELETVHGQQHNALVEQHEQELAKARRDLEAQVTALRKANEQMAAEGEKERLQALEDLVSARAEGQTGIEETRKRYEAEIAELRTRAAEAEEKAKHSGAKNAEWEGKLDKLRREHADALLVLRRQHDDERTALLNAKEEALSQRESEQYTALRKSSEERWARMQQLQEETRKQYEARLGEMQTREASSREEAAKERDAALEELEARFRDEQTKILGVVKTEWEGRVERLRREHADALAMANEEHKNELSAVRRLQDQASTGREGELQKALAKAQDEIGVMKAAAAQQEEARIKYEARIAEMRAAVAEGRSETEREHADTLTALELKLRDEKAQAVAAVQSEWEKKLEKMRRSHAQIVAALQEDQERELAARAALAQAPGLPAPPPVPAPAPAASRAAAPAAPPASLPAQAAPAVTPPAPAPALPLAVPAAPPAAAVPSAPVPTAPAILKSAAPAAPPVAAPRPAAAPPAAPPLVHAGSASSPGMSAAAVAAAVGTAPSPSPRATLGPSSARPPMAPAPGRSTIGPGSGRPPMRPPTPVPPPVNAAAGTPAPAASSAPSPLTPLPLSFRENKPRLPMPFLIAGAVALLLVVAGIGAVVLGRGGSTPAGDAAALAASQPGAGPATAGSVQVESHPDGAAVVLNGEPKGLTPLLLTGLPWGRYEVEIARSGHEGATQTVDLSEGAPTATVKVDLRPLAATPAGPKDAYLEQEVDLPPSQASGNPVAFPPNMSTTPGQSLSVGVTFMVTEDGDVTQIKIVESGGLPLDEAVLRAIATWKFEPATKGGRKVKTLLRRKFTFKT